MCRETPWRCAESVRVLISMDMLRFFVGDEEVGEDDDDKVEEDRAERW